MSPQEKDIPAPNDLHTDVAAEVSADSRGCLITLSPAARAAKNKALMVWDFEPGMSADPESFDFLTIYFKSPHSFVFKSA